jgi:6-phosphogluconolactonase (cycloisomerase 2 family)
MTKALRTAIIAALATSLGAVAAQATVRNSSFSDAVFVMSNRAEGNRVTMIRRTDSGRLVRIGSYGTGGEGSGPGEISATDPFGSQGSLTLSPDGRFLFASNAGSNEISTFRVLDDGLLLTSVVSSGGSYPVSVTMKGNIVYVLNAGAEGVVTGFRLTRSGQLLPIRGSSRTLQVPTPNAGKQPNIFFSPAQVQFSPDGDWLVISDKNIDSRGTLQLFKVGSDGQLAARPVVTISEDPAPFGFTFDRRGHLVLTEAARGAVSTYDINDDGTLQPITLSVFNGQGEPCWVDMSRNFAYVTNTATQNITGYNVARNGELTLLNPSGVSGVVGGAGSGPVDVAVSGDGRFLNVLSSGTGIVQSFRINPFTGALTLSGELKVFDGNSGAAGLTAN